MTDWKAMFEDLFGAVGEMHDPMKLEPILAVPRTAYDQAKQRKKEAAEPAPPLPLTDAERDELNGLLATVMLPTLTLREREVALTVWRALRQPDPLRPNLNRPAVDASVVYAGAPPLPPPPVLSDAVLKAAHDAFNCPELPNAPDGMLDYSQARPHAFGDDGHCVDCHTPRLSSEAEWNGGKCAETIPGRSTTDRERAGFEQMRAVLTAAWSQREPETPAPSATWTWPTQALIARMRKWLEPAIDDKTRCAICAWPLATKAGLGCVRGNCSMRPMPDRRYAPERAEWEYGPGVLPAIELPPLTFSLAASEVRFFLALLDGQAAPLADPADRPTPAPSVGAEETDIVGTCGNCGTRLWQVAPTPTPDALMRLAWIRSVLNEKACAYALTDDEQIDIVDGIVSGYSVELINSMMDGFVALRQKEAAESPKPDPTFSLAQIEQALSDEVMFQVVHGPFVNPLRVSGDQSMHAQSRRRILAAIQPPSPQETP